MISIRCLTLKQPTNENIKSNRQKERQQKMNKKVKLYLQYRRRILSTGDEF